MKSAHTGGFPGMRKVLGDIVALPPSQYRAALGTQRNRGGRVSRRALTSRSNNSEDGVGGGIQ